MFCSTICSCWSDGKEIRNSDEVKLVSMPSEPIKMVISILKSACHDNNNIVMKMRLGVIFFSWVSRYDDNVDDYDEGDDIKIKKTVLILPTGSRHTSQWGTTFKCKYNNFSWNEKSFILNIISQLCYFSGIPTCLSFYCSHGRKYSKTVLLLMHVPLSILGFCWFIIYR
mgnify:CR=1 FL=1